ncbi:MAG: cytochrome c [Chromatiales bacterium]|nr:cytochrome c [Chromatiales bacterium]
MIRTLILTAALLALAGTAQAGGDPKAGRDKSQTCQACHGADGNADNPMYPRLAGQYETYLLRALLDYKSGDRNNAIMAGMVAGLSEQDMADLAAFYASQKGLFNTVPD